MALPPSVTLCECWARDGLQSLATQIPTKDKIAMIDAIQATGVRKLEITSFSHPKLLPQFADSEDVLKGIARRDDVSYVVLMPNAKGFDRFEVCHKEGYGADEIILMISSSEEHNSVNFRMDHEAAKKAHAAIIKRAKNLGVGVIGCAGTVWGCPIAGDVPIEKVADIVGFYLAEGAETIMLGDTTGAANPLDVRRRYEFLMDRFPGTEFIAHFHDTRGNGLVNTFTALELGVRFADASIGAIGGQPATKANKYQYGFTGNTCSEDLVALLEECGVGTGIDVDRFIEVGLRAEEVVGHPMRSNVIRAGRVNHSPKQFTP